MNVPAITAQLPLSLGLKDSAVFASYHPGPNAEAVDYLRRLKGGVQQPLVFLWGEAGSGKSHLLQALCHDASERDIASFYLPMDIVDDFPLDALIGLDSMALVCIDDLQLIAGNQAWEEALIQLFSDVRDAGANVVVTASAAPNELGLVTDLASHLVWSMSFQLHNMSEEDKVAAVALRTERRGFTLRSEAARYLVRHYGENTATLFACLDTLDQASLVAKRKLTIPFIRDVLRN